MIIIPFQVCYSLPQLKYKIKQNLLCITILKLKYTFTNSPFFRPSISETNYVLHTLSLCDIQKIKPPLRAQCSPRHACPLRGAFLIQVHEGAQAAPVLVRQEVENSGFCMQSHAA